MVTISFQNVCSPHQRHRVECLCPSSRVLKTTYRSPGMYCSQYSDVYTPSNCGSPSLIGECRWWCHGCSYAKSFLSCAVFVFGSSEIGTCVVSCIVHSPVRREKNFLKRNAVRLRRLHRDGEQELLQYMFPDGHRFFNFRHSAPRYPF